MNIRHFLGHRDTILYMIIIESCLTSYIENKQTIDKRPMNLNLQYLFKSIQSNFSEFKDSIDSLDREKDTIVL